MIPSHLTPRRSGAPRRPRFPSRVLLPGVVALGVLGSATGSAAVIPAAAGTRSAGAPAGTPQQLCEGSGGQRGIAWYAGPSLPLKPSGDGFYESNPPYPNSQAYAWPTGTPASQGMNAADLSAGAAWLQRTYPNMRSFLVIKNGVLVQETYFNGANASVANDIHSASKSMLQALIGIAISRGIIGSVTDKVSTYLPGYFSGQLASEKAITIEQMLSMSSGLRWTEDSTEYQVQTSPNWVRAIADQGMSSTPGSTFNYSTGNFHLLSAMLTAAIQAQLPGRSTCDFADQFLFSPLGIVPAHWGQDPTTGVDMGGCDLYMTPRDMARFGQLYLNNGVVNGQQVVPAATVSQAQQPLFNDGQGFYYDQGFWSRTIKNVSMYFAWGYNGQFIYVIPALGIVMVTTENTQDKTGPFKEINSKTLLTNYVLPADGH